MTAETEALVRDLVAWIAEGEKPYAQVMDAWRTSCPRLPVWEEATDRRLIVRRGDRVSATPAGIAFLANTGAPSKH